MEYQTDNLRQISHEIKNQLSICDLYTEVLQKYCEKNGIEDETVQKSIRSIKRAVQLAGNSLLELKSCAETELKPYKISDLVKESVDMAEVYGANKGVNFQTEITSEAEIIADKNRFESVIINVIKNACEAFDDDRKDKRVEVLVKDGDGKISVSISNNAKPITNPKKILEEGYTTKSNGNGLGLPMCKKIIEDMSGMFELVKSDKTSTEFRITIGIEE